MKKKILILPIETKAREFEPRLLLAAYALKKGFQVYIGSKTDVTTNVANIKPGVLFHKDAWKSSLQLLTSYKERGSKLVGTDEEGLVIISDKIYLQQRIDVATLDLFDQFYMWGDRQKELVSTVYSNNSKLLSLGNSRVDFLRKDLDSYSDAQAKSIIEKYGDFVMINTKLSAYNHGKGPDGYINMFKSQGMFKTKDDEDFRYEFQAYIKELFFYYIDLIKRLSVTFPNINFVLRPHPSEKLDTWVEAAKELPNVFVDLKGNISNWIKATKAVIHTDCTTGIESVIAGKPTLSYRPLKPKREEMFLPNALSREVFTEDELIKDLTMILEQPGSFEIVDEKRKKLLDYYISNNATGELATEAIINSIDNLPVQAYSVAAIKSSNTRQLLKKKVKKTIKTLLNKETKENPYTKQKFPSMTIEEVNDCLLKIDPNLKPSYQFLDTNLLHITC